MRLFAYITIVTITIWCLLLIFEVKSDDSDFSIADESDEACETCSSAGTRDIDIEYDTSMKPKKSKKPKKPKKPRKKAPKMPQMPQMPQIPDLPPELADLSPEEYAELLQEYQKYQEHLKEEQKPENQEALKGDFPELDYADTAYKSFKEVPKSKIKPNTFGCGQVYISPGTFGMGSEDDENYVEDGESPIRKVRIKKGFWMDTCETTNGQFLQFWDEMNREGKTEAEKYGWSFVFELLISEEVNKQIGSAVQGASWWVPVPKADFRHPEGPDTNFNDKLNHPAMHIGWTDATQYCEWKGGRLPTEAEWEWAARGGLEQKKFPWGNEMHPNLTVDGTYSMNIFTGEPYTKDDGLDGYESTAPVGSYSPNAYGLHDMTGNVWEWVNDFWSTRPKLPPEGQRLVNPKGPKRGRDRVMKGGSYMCHETTCRRYRVSGRSHAEPDSSTGNLGLRCIYDNKPTEKEVPQGIDDVEINDDNDNDDNAEVHDEL